MPVNWKDPDAFTRLLAAMVAAQDMKLDYRKIATMYGNGATYDSIEGRFRIIKKDAQILKTEIDTGARPEAPARGAGPGKEGGTVTTPRKNRMGAGTGTTPKKERDRTAGGRVGKVGGKRGGVGGVKREAGESESAGGSFNFSVVEEEGGEGEGEGDWMGAGFADGGAEGYFGMDEGV